MKLAIGLSNGSSVTGVCTVEMEGSPISDGDALNLAQSVLGSDYVTNAFTVDSGTPTIDSLQVLDMSRAVPVS